MNKNEAIESYKDRIVAYYPLSETLEIVLHTYPNEDNDNHILIMIFDPSYYDHVNPVYFLKPTKAGVFPYHGKKYNIHDFKTDIENSLVRKHTLNIVSASGDPIWEPKDAILKWF